MLITFGQLLRELTADLQRCATSGCDRIATTAGYCDACAAFLARSLEGRKHEAKATDRR